MTTTNQELEIQEDSLNNTPIDDSINQPAPKAPEITTEDLLKNPVVKQLIEKAREQEKNKLYKSISDRDEIIRNQQVELEKLQGLVKAKEDESLTEAEKFQKEISTLKDSLKTLGDSIETEREAAKREKHEAQIAAYKERKIREVRESGEDLIVALVNGNSEDEVDASIEEAKEEFKKIFNKAEERIKKDIKPSVTNTPRVTNPPNAETDTLPSDIRNMDTATFAKNRDRLLKMAKVNQ